MVNRSLDVRKKDATIPIAAQTDATGQDVDLATNMNTPHSPIGHHPMRLMMTIPIDWRRPKARKAYHLFWCDQSHYGMLYPRPNNDEVASFYEVADYYTHDKLVTTSNRAMLKPSFTAWLLKRWSWNIDKSVYIDAAWFAKHHGNKPARVLDIGCGSGKILDLLRAAGHSVVGLEPDPLAREVAIGRGLEVLDGTAEQLPDGIELGSFDSVIMTHVLEHCVDPIKAINNAVSLLKPGGKVTIETPNNEAVGFQQSGSVWRWLDVPRHLNFFTPQSLAAICEIAGLNVDATEYRGYSRQFEPEWILDEQRIWDRYNASKHIGTPLPKRNTEFQSWKLFIQTFFMSDEKRYDSVRTIAQKS